MSMETEEKMRIVAYRLERLVDEYGQKGAQFAAAALALAQVADAIRVVFDDEYAAGRAEASHA